MKEHILFKGQVTQYLGNRVTLHKHANDGQGLADLIGFVPEKVVDKPLANSTACDDQFAESRSYERPIWEDYT
jgi:hypothetical protein